VGQGEVRRSRLVQFFSDPELKTEIDAYLGDCIRAGEKIAEPAGSPVRAARCLEGRPQKPPASQVAKEPERLNLNLVVQVAHEEVSRAQFQGVELLTAALRNQGGCRYECRYAHPVRCQNLGRLH
jgi:hypothetical protein